jgi:glycosyltransferase involved in cell wall biosynthesis
MRIAVITSSYPRFAGDGTAPFVQSISENLAQMGHEVEVVAPYDTAVDSLMTTKVPLHRFHYIWPKRYHIMGHARAMEKDVRLRPLTYILLPFFISAGILTLWRVAKRLKAQVIYAHWVVPNGLVAACVAGLMGIPFGVTLHGSDVFVSSRNRWLGIVARWILKRAAFITACSPDLKKGALELGASKDIVLLPNGVNPSLFHPSLRSQICRDKFLPTGKGILITTLGRLVLKKGFGNLITAMQKVIEQEPDVRLVLGGEGELKEELANQAANLGIHESVLLVGRIPWNQVPELLASSDIFCLPSIRDAAGNVDGLPTVLQEAMSSGVAVIASDIGGVGLVVEDGKNGILVPPDDVPALANAIMKLFTDAELRENLGAAARQAAEVEFPWEQFALKVVGLMEEALHFTGPGETST